MSTERSHQIVRRIEVLAIMVTTELARGDLVMAERLSEDLAVQAESLHQEVTRLKELNT